MRSAPHSPIAEASTGFVDASTQKRFPWTPFIVFGVVAAGAFYLATPKNSPAKDALRDPPKEFATSEGARVAPSPPSVKEEATPPAETNAPGSSRTLNSIGEPSVATPPPAVEAPVIKSFRWGRRTDTEVGSVFRVEFEVEGADKLELASGEKTIDVSEARVGRFPLFVSRKGILTLKASGGAGYTVSRDLELAPDPGIATDPERMIPGEPLSDNLDLFAFSFDDLDFRTLRSGDDDPLNAWLADALKEVERDASILKLIRNACFARHGYRFKDERLAKTFSERSWYRPFTDDIEAVNGMMSPREKTNVEYIQQLEKKAG